MAVIVEAVHTVKPLTGTTFDQYVDWYGEVVIPAMGRSGYEVLGAFKRTGGAMGQDVLVMRFEDMGAYERAGLALRSDPGFLKGSASRPAFEISETIKIAVPVSYATDERLRAALAAKPEKPRQYLQAVLQGKPAGLPKAYELLDQLVARVATRGMHLATAYETRAGVRGEFTDLWVMPDAPLDFAYRRAPGADPLINELRDVAPEESLYYLNPLPYSPLQ